MMDLYFIVLFLKNFIDQITIHPFGSFIFKDISIVIFLIFCFPTLSKAESDRSCLLIFSNFLENITINNEPKNKQVDELADEPTDKLRSKPQKETGELSNIIDFNHPSRIGNMGFVTAQIPYNPKLEMDLISRGYVYQPIYIFVVPSRDDAYFHRKNYSKKHPLTKTPYDREQGFYLISNELFSHIQNEPRTVSQLTFSPISYIFSPNIDMIWIDEHETIQVFSPASRNNTMSRNDPYPLQWANNSDGTSTPYFLFKGWAQPNIRGIIQYEDTRNSSTYKRIKSNIRKMLSLGYTIKVNQDFPQVMDILQQMIRATSNRYDQQRIEVTMEHFNNGNAFSFEIWSPGPDSKIVGGNIVIKKGGLLKVDSVFYRSSIDHFDGIDFSKFADFALIVWLNNKGISWNDSGTKITSYSASIKAKEISLPEFIDMASKLPENVPLPDNFDFLYSALGLTIPVKK